MDEHRTRDWAWAARADNLLWEERVGTDRQHGYETALAGATNWQKAHNAFLQSRIYGADLPETFTLVNASARLGEVVTTVGCKSWLVRIESLAYAVEHRLLPRPVDQLRDHLDILRGRHPLPDDLDVTMEDIEASMEALV
ncbi:MAG: hypothetical protein HQL41_18010 [Alphaproteobacteria bacterium]|nr:hypothetical protein [Alphaproteobacteria bacterium]